MSIVGEVAELSMATVTGEVSAGKIECSLGTGFADQKGENDITFSNGAVIIPAGYYANAIVKEIPTGSAMTPETSVLVTPVVTINPDTLEITAAIDKFVYIMPIVEAGYISSGVSGKVTITGATTIPLEIE